MTDITARQGTDFIVSLPAVNLQSANAARVFDADRLNRDQRERARRLADAVNFHDSMAAAMYGSETLMEFSKALDNLLEGVKIEDLGRAGDILIDARKVMDSMKLKKLRNELKHGSLQYFCAKIPFLGKYLSAARYFVERKRNFLTLVHNMERSAVTRRYEIIESQQVTNRHIETIRDQYDELAVLILGGQMALQRGAAEYEALCERARTSEDAVLQSLAHTFHERLVALDTRILELTISYSKAPIDNQQLEMASTAGRITLQNIQNMLDFTLRDMKSAVFLAASLYHVERANEEMLSAKSIEERISTASMEMLGDAYLGSKKLQGAGLDKAQRLAGLIDKLTKLVDEGLEADRQNVLQRRQAEQNLIAGMTEYKKALTDLRAKLPSGAELAVTAEA